MCRFACALAVTFALLLLVSQTALAGTQVTSEEPVTRQTAATTTVPTTPATSPAATKPARETTADSLDHTQAPDPQNQSAYLPAQTVSDLPGTPEAGSAGPDKAVNTFNQAAHQPTLSPALQQAKAPAPEVAAPLEEPVKSALSPAGQAETLVPDPITYEAEPVVPAVTRDVAPELAPAAVILDQVPQRVLSEDTKSEYTKSLFTKSPLPILDGVTEASSTPEAGVSIGEPAPVLTMANVDPEPGQKVVMSPETGANVTTEPHAYEPGQGYAFAADRRSLSTDIVLKDRNPPSKSIYASIYATFEPVSYAGLLLSKAGMTTGHTDLAETEALQDAPSLPLHSPLQGGNILSGTGSFSGSVIQLLGILLLLLISLLYRARSWTLYESPKPVLASHQAPKRPG